MQQVRGHHQAMVNEESAQVEAIEEGLQTQLWAGNFDYDMFIAATDAACAMSGNPAYDLSGIDVRTSLYEGALTLFRQ